MSNINILLIDNIKFYISNFNDDKQYIYNIFNYVSIDDTFMLLNNNEIDVILLDFNFPDICGIELFSRIRKDYHLVQIIILSSEPECDNIYFAISMGAYDFYIKPLYIPDLLETINKAYDSKNTLQYFYRNSKHNNHIETVN